MHLFEVLRITIWETQIGEESNERSHLGSTLGVYKGKNSELLQGCFERILFGAGRI